MHIDSGGIDALKKKNGLSTSWSKPELSLALCSAQRSGFLK